MYQLEYLDLEENKEYESIVEKVVIQCLKEEKLENSKLYISITLTTPEHIHEINKQYRNVDKEATESIAENEGKIVYDYAGGTAETEGSTDPSGIDAEKSIANGARIVYLDSNNSTKDFHQRKFASLTGK